MRLAGETTGSGRRSGEARALMGRDARMSCVRVPGVVESRSRGLWSPV